MDKQPTIGWQSNSEESFSMLSNPGVVLHARRTRRQPSPMLREGRNWEAAGVRELRCGRCKRGLAGNEHLGVYVRISGVRLEWKWGATVRYFLMKSVWKVSSIQSMKGVAGKER